MEYTKLKELSEKLKNSTDSRDAVLSEVTDCIWEYTKEQMQRIKEHVCSQEADGREAFDPVTTVFANDSQAEQLEEAGFCTYDAAGCLPVHIQPDLAQEMAQKLWNAKKKGEKRLSIGSVFLYCEYRRLLEIVDHCVGYTGSFLCADGSTVPFTYYLRLSDRLLQKERILKRCAQLYGICAPDVFSPMARRLAEVCVDLKGSMDKIGKVTGVDFGLVQNQLHNVFAVGKRLMWNIRQQEQDLDVVRMSPLGGQKHFTYTFEGCTDRQFVVPVAHDADCLETRRVNGRLSLVFDKEYNGRFAKLTIQKTNPLPLQAECFTNRHAQNDPSLRAGKELERICSEADIWYACSQHVPQLGMELRELSNDPLYGYTEPVGYRDQADGTDVETISLRSAKSVYLYFENSAGSLFADDYLNYLCGYLNRMYPQVWWKGGYR